MLIVKIAAITVVAATVTISGLGEISAGDKVMANNTLAESSTKATITPQNYWFRVSETTIESTPVSESELETELCDLPFSAGRPVCAVAFESETELTTPPTTNLEETSVIDPQNGEPVAEVRYKEPE